MNALFVLRLLRRRSQFRRRERWTRQRLDAYRAEAVQRLRSYSYSRSPFYQRFHEGLFDRPLSELPILTKAQLMDSFDDLVTDRSVRLSEVQAYLADGGGDRKLYLGRYRVAATSGSTGLRGVFLANTDEWLSVLASYSRANTWAGVMLGLTKRVKLAVVSSRNPAHQSALVGATLQSRLVPTLRLDATQPLSRIVSALNAFQPECLVAYASMARILAEEQLAGRLQICPRAVMSASEVLTDESARRIEQAWRSRPFNVYAATEPAGIASECDQHRGMHLYEDLVITEVVDERNRPVPPGIYGDKILVTVLFNHTQPLIRYEISDCVRPSAGSCGCGRPFRLIDGILGRQEDSLQMPAVGDGLVRIHPNVFHAVLDGVPVSGWQVVHETDGLRVLLAGLRHPFDDESALRRDLAEALAKQGAAVPEIRVERVTEIPKTQLGKAPLVRRAVQQRDGRPAVVSEISAGGSSEHP